MFTIGEFERINTNYKLIQENRRKKLVKVWGILLTVTIFVIVIFIIIFPNQFNNHETVWILPTYGGIAFLINFIGLIISTQYRSEKPVVEFVFDEVMKKINMYEGLFLNYKPYDKEDKGFNKVGGLFPNNATVKVKRHVSGDTTEHDHFNIYDCTMITSTGNSSQTHFSGVYFVLNRQVNTSIQIRTNGSPKLKGIKFNRLDEFEGLRVYKQRDQSMTNMDHTLVAFMNKLSEDPKYKRVFLSVVGGEIHLGLWYKVNPLGKIKVLSVERLNVLATYFMSEYKMIEKLSEIDNY